MSRQITKAEYWGQTIQDGFFGDYRELIAHFSGVTEGITSFLQLNFADELIAFSKKPDPRLYRRLLTEALVTLIDRRALTQIAADLNDLAEVELANLRRETGIGVEMLPPPPPKAPTAEELLRQEIANDWQTLPMKKVKEKKNSSRQYAEMLDRMANEGSLDSVATSLQRAGG
jgi:hypothetical protein